MEWPNDIYDRCWCCKAINCQACGKVVCRHCSRCRGCCHCKFAGVNKKALAKVPRIDPDSDARLTAEDRAFLKRLLIRW